MEKDADPILVKKMDTALSTIQGLHYATKFKEGAMTTTKALIELPAYLKAIQDIEKRRAFARGLALALSNQAPPGLRETLVQVLKNT